MVYFWCPSCQKKFRIFTGIFYSVVNATEHYSVIMIIYFSILQCTSKFNTWLYNSIFSIVDHGGRIHQMCGLWASRLKLRQRILWCFGVLLLWDVEYKNCCEKQRRREKDLKGMSGLKSTQENRFLAAVGLKRNLFSDKQPVRKSQEDTQKISGCWNVKTNWIQFICISKTLLQSSFTENKIQQ